MATTFSPGDVAHIAHLAQIPITEKEKKKLTEGFNTTMKVVDTLLSVDVKGVVPTSRVTGFGDVYREDEIDTSRMFTQEEALANAPRKHNGFFEVDQVLEDD
jgi:aspartyl-tRNA(Asn)/glutamyl-tRNA(Gln) amidotransferase subunit C